MQIYEKKITHKSSQNNNKRAIYLSSRCGETSEYVLKILTFFSSSISWILNFVANKSTFASVSLAGRIK